MITLFALAGSRTASALFLGQGDLRRQYKGSYYEEKYSAG
jgi:hypothetical protein